MSIDQIPRPAPLTISEQVRAADNGSNVIDLSQATWSPPPYPPPPDPLAVLKQGYDDPEALAEAARYLLRIGSNDIAVLKAIGLALLAIQAELRDGRAER